MTDMTTTVRVRPLADVRTAGILAGPLFLAVSAAQLPLNDGIDLTRHAFSFLELGPHGWIQQANFIVAGGLYVVSATGLRTTGRGRHAIPALLTLLGAGLIIAGLFPPDPALGYPSGAPAGVPDSMSAAGVLHGFGFAIGTLSWVGMLAVAAIRHRGTDRRRAVACAVMAAALLAVPAMSGLPDGAVYLYAAVTTGLLFNSWLLAHWQSERGSEAASC